MSILDLYAVPSELVVAPNDFSARSSEFAGAPSALTVAPSEFVGVPSRFATPDAGLPAATVPAPTAADAMAVPTTADAMPAATAPGAAVPMPTGADAVPAATAPGAAVSAPTGADAVPAAAAPGAAVSAPTGAGVRTYRGKTLEQVLPKIRAELGPDAVILRQRDGLLGGVGGFFATRFVEIEARAGDAPAAGDGETPSRSTGVQRRSGRGSIDIYDAEDAATPEVIVVPDAEDDLSDAAVSGDAAFSAQLNAAVSAWTSEADGAAEITRPNVIPQAEVEVEITPAISVVPEAESVPAITAVPASRANASTVPGAEPTPAARPEAAVAVPEAGAPSAPRATAAVPEAEAPAARPEAAVAVPEAEAPPAPRATAVMPEAATSRTPQAAAEVTPPPRTTAAATTVPSVTPARTRPTSPRRSRATSTERRGHPKLPRRPASPRPLDQAAASRIVTDLVALGTSTTFAADVVGRAAAHGAATGGGLRAAARTELSRRIRPAASLPGAGAAIAFVGAGGSGKSLAVAALATSYRHCSTLPVSVVTLTDSHGHRQLADVLAEDEVPVTRAGNRALASVQQGRRGGMLIVDTPAVSPTDPAGVTALAGELGSLGLDGIYAVLPATLSASAARRALSGLAPLAPDGLLISHADESDQLGTLIELAATDDLPIAYVTAGAEPRRSLIGADPAALASLLLP